VAHDSVWSVPYAHFMIKHTQKAVSLP